MPEFKYVIVFFILSFSSFSYSQVADLARLEYTHIPQSSSDNSVNRFRAFIN